ncbi:MAG: hypothetical protein QOH03_5483, partial [Kribbellaceae bacterium]|nr:hypothetical protein [Kribbellaceae bacterium]
DLGLDATGADKFFGTATCSNEAVAGCVDATVTQGRLGDPTSISVSGGGLDMLKAFNLGGGRSRDVLIKVQAGLRALSDSVRKLPQLAGPDAAGPLTASLPLMGLSIGDLIDTSKLDSAVAALQNAVPGSLDDLAATLNQALGADSGISFTASTGSDGKPVLLAHIVQKSAVDRSVPLNLSLGAPGTDTSAIAGAAGSGQIDVTGSVDVDMTLAIGVDPAAGGATPATLKVMPDSKFGANLKVDGGGTMAATFGPYSVKLGDGADQSTLHAAIDLGLADPSPGDDPVSFSDWASNLDAEVNQDSPSVHCTSADADYDLDICASLPVYMSDDGGASYHKVSANGNNDLNLRLPASDATFDPFGNDISGPNGGSLPRLELPDGLYAAFANSALSFGTFRWGAKQLFGIVSDGLDKISAGGGLPLVGSDLQEGRHFVQDLQQHVDDAFAALPPAAGLTSGSLRDTIKSELASALGNTLQSQVDVTLTCVGGPCDGTEPATDVIKAAVAFDAGSTSADVSQCQTPSAGCAGFTLPLDFDLPGLSMTGDPVHGAVGWTMHVAFGLDKNGFYVDPGNKLKVGLGVSAPSQLDGMLTFLHVGFHDLNDGSVPLFSGVASAGLDNSGPRSLDDIVANLSNYLDLGLSADARADWHIDASADSAFPGIATDLHLRWSLTNPDSAPSLIKFDNVSVVPGSILEGVLGPVAREVDGVIQPVRPFIDLLTTPIPVLTDLSETAGFGPMTVESLAGIAGEQSGDQRIQMAHRVAVIASITSRISAIAGSGQPIPLGSFEVDPAEAKNGAPPESEIRNPQEDPTAGWSTFQQSLFDAAFPGARDLADLLRNQNESGLTFPAFDDPSKLFGLLLGQDVDVAKFDLGQIKIDLGPPLDGLALPNDEVLPITIGASAEAHINAQLRGGFDTFGIRRAVKNGSVGDVFDGFYLNTRDANGDNTPNLEVQGDGYLFAKVNGGIGSLEAKGGLHFDTALRLRDNPSGKFRPSNVARVQQGLGCVFGANFDSYAYFKIKGTLGPDPPSPLSAEWTLAQQPLFDFQSSCPAGDGDPGQDGNAWTDYRPKHDKIGGFQGIGAVAKALNDNGDVLGTDGGGDLIWSSKDSSATHIGHLGKPQDLNDIGQSLFLQDDGRLALREPGGRVQTIPQRNVADGAKLSGIGAGACASLVYGNSEDGPFVADASESTVLPDHGELRNGHSSELRMVDGNSSRTAIANGIDRETAFVSFDGGDWEDITDFTGVRGVAQVYDINDAGDILADLQGVGPAVIHKNGSYDEIDSGATPVAESEGSDLVLRGARVQHGGRTYDLKADVDGHIADVWDANQHGQFLGETGDGSDIVVTVPSWAPQDDSAAASAGCKPPDPPTGVDVDTFGPTADVFWDEPESSRGITGYLIDRYTNPAQITHLGSVDSHTFDFVDSNAPEGAHYIVRAEGVGGVSDGTVAAVPSGFATVVAQPGQDAILDFPDDESSMALPAGIVST